MYRLTAIYFLIKKVIKMFDWSLKLKEELRDDKGIQHIKEIYIVKEGKNDLL